jgi:hypothetical protein
MFFLQCNEEVTRLYSGLFNQGNKEVEEGEQKEQGKTFSDHWGWVTVLDALSNNQVKDWEAIANMPVIEFLNAMAYYKDKQRYLDVQSRLHG